MTEAVVTCREPKTKRLPVFLAVPPSPVVREVRQVDLQPERVAAEPLVHLRLGSEIAAVDPCAPLIARLDGPDLELVPFLVGADDELAHGSTVRDCRLACQRSPRASGRRSFWCHSATARLEGCGRADLEIRRERGSRP